MVSEPVEQRGGHLGITEHLGPFAEAEIGGDDDAGALVKLAQQVEPQRAALGAERQISKLIEDAPHLQAIRFASPSRTVMRLRPDVICCKRPALTSATHGAVQLHGNERQQG